MTLPPGLALAGLWTGLQLPRRPGFGLKCAVAGYCWVCLCMAVESLQTLQATRPPRPELRWATCLATLSPLAGACVAAAAAVRALGRGSPSWFFQSKDNRIVQCWGIMPRSSHLERPSLFGGPSQRPQRGRRLKPGCVGDSSGGILVQTSFFLSTKCRQIRRLSWASGPKASTACALGVAVRGCGRAQTQAQEDQEAPRHLHCQDQGQGQDEGRGQLGRGQGGAPAGGVLAARVPLGPVLRFLA